MTKKVIPLEAIPDVGSHLVRRDDHDYLVMNDAMFTFYQRSMGEFSPFFLALRDERKILGCRCPSCGIVRIPPFMTRCPDCSFASTELIEVGQVGRMLSTPPITYFANSLFTEQVPFGRGRVILEGADTAMSVNVYTTSGILVPGIIERSTEVKVVFKDERMGEITDIFCVPVTELRADQVARTGLLASEIDWAAAVEPTLPARTPEARARYDRALEELRTLAAAMSANERTRRDIAGWHRIVHAKTAGGDLTIRIDDGDLAVEPGLAGSPDFVMVAKDASTIADGIAYRGSLTQAILRKDLWISRNPEFTTIFKLERMARSFARSKKS